MSEREYRPIERTDYERAYAVLHALENHRHEPSTPIWEHLISLHEEKVSDEGRQPSADLTGDQGFNAELTRAFILLELVQRGETQMPVTVSAMQGVCAVPGCGERTVGVYCLNCELEQDQGPAMPDG